jgi:hypothetical protein
MPQESGYRSEAAKRLRKQDEDDEDGGGSGVLGAVSRVVSTDFGRLNYDVDPPEEAGEEEEPYNFSSPKKKGRY